MRKSVTIKIGDKLLFSPDPQAIGGPDSAFFEKYEGMQATVLGFDESENNRLSGFLRRLAESEEDEDEPDYRFFVEFENGDKPKTSLASLHFMVP